MGLGVRVSGVGVRRVAMAMLLLFLHNDNAMIHTMRKGINEREKRQLVNITSIVSSIKSFAFGAIGLAACYSKI